MTTTGRSTTGRLEHVEAPGALLTRTAARALAVLRIALGSVFLWAFLDKLFGLGYSTPGERAWINGGSPTNGFLSHADIGPFRGMFQSIAGATWADWGFMIGLLGIGLALVLGIGMRVAAVSAAVMLGLMYLAELPFVRTTAGGEPTGSTNPLVDSHLVYAIGAVVLALTYAGHTWGLGRWWAGLPIVQRYPWLA